MRIPVSERIEASAQNHILNHSALDRCTQLIFGKPAAHRHESPQIPRDVFAISRLRGVQFRGCFGANNRARNGIVEHSGMIENLVSRAMHRNTQCGSTGPRFNHLLVIRWNSPRLK